MNNDTIAAISTAIGVGAISIVRVSGNNAVNIVNSIVKNKNLLTVKSHTINYNHIVDNDEIIDEVLISVMLAPKTFTTEDVVEINCHGGISTTNKILELLLSNGCRLAEPGEFTKRAFLNGRIDLVKAEAVMDLINSKTEKARDLAIRQLDGQVSNEIFKLRTIINKTIANIEVNIDYPEYDDIPEITNNEIKNTISVLKTQINKFLKNSESGQIIKDGINTAIIGRPNVGKSSILNRLLNEEKAIVTDIEGTTRDIVEGKVIVNGIVLNIIDTAGIRETNDIIEYKGVQKSLEFIDKADLILFVLNNNEKISDEEKEILNKIRNKNHIIIINKTDLPSNIDEIEDDNIVYISALNNEGIESLKQKISDIYNLELIDLEDQTYLSNARSVSLLKNCLKLINNIEEGLNQDLPVDMLEIDLREIWSLLGSIIGENYDDELIDTIFSQFCLGK